MIGFFSPLRFAFKGWYLLLTLVVSLLYLTLPTFIINIRLMVSLLMTSESFLSRLQVIAIILLGSFVILTPLEKLFALLTAVLLGMNISLLIQAIRVLRKQHSLTLAVGGSSLIALVGVGCASCGVSILSVLGVSGALLPIHGIWYTIFSVILLFLSLLVILKNKEVVCKLT